jgi:hypothetical protein
MRTLLSVLFFLVTLLGCSRNTSPEITPPTFAQIDEFATSARITLPASAQAVGWSRHHGRDKALWLQVRLPASDLRAFLESSPFQGKMLTNEKYWLTVFESFLVAPPVYYRGGRQSLPNGKFLNILVDESDSSNLVVYLMWFET